MNKIAATTEQLAAALQVAKIALQAITEAGISGIPSGVLYAAMMGTFSRLETYESMVDLLVKSRVVERLPNHVLRAVAVVG